MKIKKETQQSYGSILKDMEQRHELLQKVKEDIINGKVKKVRNDNFSLKLKEMPPEGVTFIKESLKPYSDKTLKKLSAIDKTLLA